MPKNPGALILEWALFGLFSIVAFAFALYDQFQQNGGLRWWDLLTCLALGVMLVSCFIIMTQSTSFFESSLSFSIAYCGVAFFSLILLDTLVEKGLGQWLVALGVGDLLWSVVSLIVAVLTGKPLWTINSLSSLVVGLIILAVEAVQFG